MLISDKIVEAFNRQIGNELAASLQYLAISAYFSSETLPELARRFETQSIEERDHARKFIDYVVDSGGQVRFPEMPAPQSTFDSAEAAVQVALDSEMAVTRQISALVDLSIGESDHQAQSFLKWFVDEQREEVALMDTLLKMVQRAGESGLLFVEDYLSRNAVGPDAPAG